LLNWRKLMKKHRFSIAAAFVAAATTAALAQAGAQSSTQSQTGAAPNAQQDQQVTIVGCVQREADYRKAQSAGRGGVAGTGVGVGNEFVLVNASTASAGTAATPGSAATPTGTAGTTSATAYELTGPNEGQVEKFVGRRIEISGKLKPAETSAGRPTGGPTAGAPPRGVDVGGQDLMLRELEITSVRETSGACPAQ
jgi:hypothetical protein